ncbi:hypothetical protein GJ744_001920 [Endocarpon pusillum]|uniref:AB hydrolase-1 domain-containing protein n=1 Tax=Endocarpon pusillum TaxID=364733 RepID=A0A8H7E7Q1_9EURO|nr:hypothetical protein GJ744_001920 [Endocarpon pusillum]
MVYLLDSFLSLFTLRWVQSPAFFPLPPTINRTFIKTPSGDIELLVSAPSLESGSPASVRNPPVLFVHGGFGYASEWLPWMTYLRHKQYSGTTYAVSIRGHGASWTPGFWRMYLTTKDTLATDLVAAIEEIERREGAKRVVLVGHSSGGGLSQLVLSKGLAKAQGLALVAAIPNFGARGVYWNWFKMDPWFLIRNLIHLQHPRSPLSSDTLVHNAFFSQAFPQDKVREFSRQMSAYESMTWAIGMMKRFTDVPSILANIQGWGTSSSRVMVMAAEADKLMGVKLMMDMAGEYREGVEGLSIRKKIEHVELPQTESRISENVKQDVKSGVTTVVVMGAGHHVQNDVQADEAAEALKRFLDQL